MWQPPPPSQVPPWSQTTAPSSPSSSSRCCCSSSFQVAAAIVLITSFSECLLFVLRATLCCYWVITPVAGSTQGGHLGQPCDLATCSPCMGVGWGPTQKWAPLSRSHLLPVGHMAGSQHQALQAPAVHSIFSRSPSTSTPRGAVFPAPHPSMLLLP